MGCNIKIRQSLLLAFLLFYSAVINNNVYDQISQEAINNLSLKSLNEVIDFLKQFKSIHVLKQLESIHVSSWSKSYHLLPALINIHNYETGCEIGVAFGTHSLALLETTNIKLLYSIDPYLHYPATEYDDSMNLNQDCFDILYVITRQRLQLFKNRSILLREKSLDAAKKFKKYAFDFIYLDANHSYESVKADLDAWYELVRPGGLIAGDDYGHIQFSGVKRAVDEFFNNKNLIVHTDTHAQTFFWVIKPEERLAVEKE